MRKILVIATLSIFTLIGIDCFAQPGGVPGGPGGGGQPVGGGEVPLDGGAVALIAGGAVILYRKYMANKKEV